MSGLVKFVKKRFKQIRETVKKVAKSKIFKVVVIAAAAVFTGGAALAMAGSIGAGGGLMATLSAGFQGGMAALGSVGTAIANGVRAIMPGGATGAAGAAGSASATGATTATAHGIAGTAQGASMEFAKGAAVDAAAKSGMSGLTKAALINTGGNMITGYAQGRAREEEIKQVQQDRLGRDHYGYDGYGRKTGDLVNPTERLAAIAANQDPALRVSLDTPPQPVAARPGVASPGSELETAMRKRLLASLDGLQMPGVAHA